MDREAYINKHEIQRLYVEERLSTREIASLLNISQSSVMVALEAIPRRSKSEAANRHGEPLQFSGRQEDLAYLTGVCLGDGCLVQQGRTELLDIACDTHYPGLIERYSILVGQVFGKEPSCRKVPSVNCVHIRLYGTGIDAILGLGLGSKQSRALHIPEWIRVDTVWGRWCLRGLFETDGYWHHRRGREKSVVIGFSNTNGTLLDDVEQLLYQCGYTSFRRSHNRIDCWQYEEAMKFMRETGFDKS
jgi:LAGLIDADG DNA endonuclease family protein